MVWRGFLANLAVCALGLGASLPAQQSIAAALFARERGNPSASASTELDSGVAQPAGSLEAALQAAFAHAGVIFAGEVVSVDRTAQAVVMRWRVDDAVRGVTAGGFFEQREWPGLWASGDVRYRAGERALVLLSAPSVGGYTSPVGDGVIPLRGDAIAGTMDLRWMAQEVAVTDAARLRPMLALRAAGGSIPLSDALMTRSAQQASMPHAQGLLRLPSTDDGDAGVTSGVVLQPPANSVKEDANAHVDGAIVLGMMHAWQRAAAVK